MYQSRLIWVQKLLNPMSLDYQVHDSPNDVTMTPNDVTMNEHICPCWPEDGHIWCSSPVRAKRWPNYMWGKHAIRGWYTVKPATRDHCNERPTSDERPL